MKLFKYYVKEQALLLENRIEAIKNIFKGKLDTSHDSLAVHKDSDAIVDHFATHADPTKNKVHTQWIVSKYRKKDFRQEDHPRIKAALSDFETHKSKLPKKDLNQYSSISDVEDAVSPHSTESSPVSNKEIKRQIKSSGAELVHDDKELGVTVHKLKTKEAACQYGAGTKWCTAAKENNMFDHYNKDGPIHVIQHKGRKYQFHTQSNQFMDEKDRAVQHSDLHDDIQSSLAKSGNPEFHKALFMINSPHLKPHHIDKALDDKNPLVRYDAMSHPTAVQPHHIDRALNDENVDVRRNAIRHPTAVQPHHIDKALNDKSSAIKWHAIHHPTAVQPHHIDKALDDKNASIRLYSIIHPTAVQPHHIDRALNDEDALVRGRAIHHPTAVQPHHIDRALNDENIFVHENAKRAKNLLINRTKKISEDIKIKSFNHYVKEAWGKDTWKATKVHYKLERKAGNQLMHPAAIAGIATTTLPGVFHSIHSGNHALTAFNAAMLTPSLAPHVKDIIKIRKAIKAVKNRNQVKEASSPYHSNPGDRDMISQDEKDANTSALGGRPLSRLERAIKRDSAPEKVNLPMRIVNPETEHKTPVYNPERSNSPNIERIPK